MIVFLFPGIFPPTFLIALGGSMPELEESHQHCHGPLWVNMGGPAWVNTSGPVWVNIPGPQWVNTGGPL